MNSGEKVDPTTPKTPAPSPADKAADPQKTDVPALTPAKKRKTRFDQTRGLLQQALADWETSEKKATEALKETESQKVYIEDLMKELKAKLDEFSP